jgi:YebC/PmpR family DNA-binding regulatory protein
VGAQWKHKGRTENAAARGRLFGKLAKEVIVAAKAGADPESNARLRAAVEAAKKASMPRDTLDRAIKKGAGLLDGPANYEVVTYEGFAPHQVAVIVECLTDNRTRTASNVRLLFRKGQLAAAGAVSWDFEHLGAIEASPPAPGIDAEAAAIEAGAQDLEPGEEGQTRFYTAGADLDAVAKALSAAKWAITSQALVWRAKNKVSLDESKRADVEAFLQALDEDDDVQHIYAAL